MTDERASSIQEGWVIREYGDDEWIKVSSVDYWGDTVLVVGTKGEHPAIDIDTVIERKHQPHDRSNQ